MRMRHEQREARRFHTDFPLEYRLAGRGADGVGWCVDSSESGMRFLTMARLEPGTLLTVRVPPRRQGLPVLTRLASVVRCLRLDDRRGYTIGCAYD